MTLLKYTEAEGWDVRYTKTVVEVVPVVVDGEEGWGFGVVGVSSIGIVMSVRKVLPVTVKSVSRLRTTELMYWIARWRERGSAWFLAPGMYLIIMVC